MPDTSTDKHIPDEQEPLQQLYKERGFQQQDLKDYLAVQKLQEERKKFRMPVALQFILTTPFILLFCLGLIFIPFMLYLVLTAGQ